MTQLTDLSQDELARTLAMALREALKNGDTPQLQQTTHIIETLAERLIPEFEPLVFYAHSMAKWVDGNTIGAVVELRRLKRSGYRFKPGYYSVVLSKQYGCLKIVDIMLDMPSEIFAHGEIISKAYYDGGGHFSTLRTSFTDLEILKNSLKELGFIVKTNDYVRGYLGKRIHAEIVVVLEGDYDLGWKRNVKGCLDLVCDLGGISEFYEINTLIKSITEQYKQLNIEKQTK